MSCISKFEGEHFFLSNFCPSEIEYEGIRYPTVEHAFQAAKTNDRGERIDISKQESPGKAKYLGRRVQLRCDWEEIKDDVMYQLLKIKFSDSELGKKLLKTGDLFLQEGNWWHDNYWGNCSCEKCREIEGKNRLGKILMKIREELRK